MNKIATVVFCIAFLAGCGSVVPDWLKSDPNAEFYDNETQADIRRYLTTKSSEPSVYTSEIAQKFTEYNLVAPNGNRIRVCSAYGCTFKQIYRLSANTLRQAKNKIAGSWSSDGERQGIIDALQHIERQMGPALGLDKDTKGGPQLSNSDKGQMNSVDEALNTTSILMVIWRYKMINNHDLLAPEWKNGGLYAIVRDRTTGKKYGIDTGYEDHGGKMVMFDWDGSATP